MNRKELVAAIAAHTEQDVKSVDATLRGLVDVVGATIKKGDPVAISGFAKFAVRKSPARTARNPQTGEPVKVKASTKVRITPLKALKDVATGAAPAPKLNAPKAAAKAAPAKKAAPAAKAAPAKKAAPAAKAAPAKKAAPAAKAAPAKKAAKK
jgi:DNA-binding protein HU-beta